MKYWTEIKNELTVEGIFDLLKKMNISEAAKHLNVPYHRLYHFIKTNNIEYVGREGNGKSKATLKSRAKSRKIQNKQQIIELYVNQHKSMNEIASLLDISNVTVLNTLRRYQIESRLKNGLEEYRKPQVSKETLLKLYLTDNLSMKEIAEVLGYPHHGQVQQDMIYYNISPRTYKEAGKMLYKKHPEKREIHRAQFYAGITGPKTNKITDIEQAFMNWADNNNISYTYQFQIRPNWHRYDFLIDNTNIIVEMDGVFWHSKPNHVERDKRFDDTAARFGYKVIRITSNELKHNPDIFNIKLMETITNANA